MAKDDLTLAEVRSALVYEPDTGFLIWRVRRNQFAVPGRQAGCVDSNGYLKIQLMGKTRCAHRLAWALHFGEYPDGEVDHINGVRSDNRLCNLRVLPHHMNMQNQRRARSDNKCGLLGASLYKPNGRWKAQIQVRGKKIGLGYFDTAEAAHEAYLAAKREMHDACTI